MSRFTEHQLTDLGLLKNGISELLVSERTLYKNNLTAAHIFSAATDKDGKDANKGKKKTIKNIYLQINSKAKNESLKNFRGKHKSHGNLASATINPQTADENQREAFEEMWKEMERQAREKPG